MGLALLINCIAPARFFSSSSSSSSFGNLIACEYWRGGKLPNGFGCVKRQFIKFRAKLTEIAMPAMIRRSLNCNFYTKKDLFNFHFILKPIKFDKGNNRIQYFMSSLMAYEVILLFINFILYSV